MSDKESVLLRQMDELLKDIASRDHLIADLRAQINDAGDTDIDWYRQELSKSAVVLKELRTRITELEERLNAWPEIVQRRAELAVAGEKNRILKELSRMSIDPVLLIDIQVAVTNYSQYAVGPAQDDGEEST